MNETTSAAQASSKPKTTAQDFFLQLLGMVTLYISAASFLTVVFQVINTYISDPLDSAYAAESRLAMLRFGLSCLIIAFPVYLGTMVYISKRFREDMNRRKMAVRRWLISFTLFVAVLIMIGDSVALVNNLLSGEMKLRFILKACSILFVLASIFFYYLQDLRTKEPALIESHE